MGTAYGKFDGNLESGEENFKVPADIRSTIQETWPRVSILISRMTFEFFVKLSNHPDTKTIFSFEQERFNSHTSLEHSISLQAHVTRFNNTIEKVVKSLNDDGEMRKTRNELHDLGLRHQRTHQIKRKHIIAFMQGLESAWDELLFDSYPSEQRARIKRAWTAIFRLIFAGMSMGLSEEEENDNSSGADATNTRRGQNWLTLPTAAVGAERRRSCISAESSPRSRRSFLQILLGGGMNNDRGACGNDNARETKWRVDRRRSMPEKLHHSAISIVVSDEKGKKKKKIIT